MKEIYIGKDDAGQRVDRFLMKTFETLPKSLLYKAIRSKKVKRNRKRVQLGDKLCEGDTLQLFLPEDVLQEKQKAEKWEDFLPAPDIIYEDAQILVVSKPAGLLSVPDFAGRKDTAIARIQNYLKKTGAWNPADSYSFAPAIVSRLDRNTSGLIVAAKTAEALRILSGGVQDRKIHKHYTAWVEGEIEEDPGKVVFWLKKEGTRAIVSKKPFDGAVKAEMIVKVLEQKNGQSKVGIDLLTGRFHQIRAGMALLHHPLAADRKYGSRKDGMYFLKADGLKLDLPGLEASGKEFHI